MKFRIIIVLAVIFLAAGIIISQNSAKKNAPSSVTPTNTEVKLTPTPTQGNTQISTPSAQGTNAPTMTPAQNQAQVGATFEIRDTVTSISGNSFVIAGKTIVIDRSKVVNFQQTTILEVGKTIQVEGVTINGVMYAREIKLSSQGGKN